MHNHYSSPSPPDVLVLHLGSLGFPSSGSYVEQEHDLRPRACVYQTSASQLMLSDAYSRHFLSQLDGRSSVKAPIHAHMCKLKRRIEKGALRV